LIVSVSLFLMAIWYIKSPFGSLWINAGDAWADGAILTTVENAKRIPWQETWFFPIRGIARTMDSVSIIPEQGYAYVYTHWPSGYEWTAFALDRIGIGSLTGKRVIMVALSFIGLALWARFWSLWSDRKLGAYYFGIAGLSYWFLSWSTTLGYWVSYVVLLSGLQLCLWSMPGIWGRRRLLGSWLLLLLTSLFSLKLLPWSFVVLGGLVLWRVIDLTWKQWMLLMTAPVVGMGSLFLRLFWLSKLHGFDEISSKFMLRTSWLQYLTSPDYYALLALRMEYYLGIGILLLIAVFLVESVKRQKHAETSKFCYVWGVTSIGGITWWFAFPHSFSEHPQLIVLTGLAQTALWAKLLSGGLRLTYVGSRANSLISGIFIIGLITRLCVGYFNRIVPIPNTLGEQTISGVCATDGAMIPAIQTLVGIPCPHMGSGRFGGDNLSWEIDSCKGRVREGSFIHFTHVPRVNIPGLDKVYMVYDRWRNHETLSHNVSHMGDLFDVPGQPDAAMVWQQGPVSLYEPVYYCVKGGNDPW